MILRKAVITAIDGEAMSRWPAEACVTPSSRDVYVGVPADGPPPKPDQKYVDEARPVVEQQLEKGGPRLGELDALRELIEGEATSGEFSDDESLVAGEPLWACPSPKWMYVIQTHWNMEMGIATMTGEAVASSWSDHHQSRASRLQGAELEPELPNLMPPPPQQGEPCVIVSLCAGTDLSAFGEQVSVKPSGVQTNGASTLWVETTQPGGGPEDVSPMIDTPPSRQWAFKPPAVSDADETLPLTIVRWFSGLSVC
jgi:hypothetical protein